MVEKVYKWVSALADRHGVWVFETYVRIVAAGFFVLYPKGLADSLRFYRTLFPDKGATGRLLCSWRQYRNFATIFLDRFLLERSGEIPYVSEGWGHIEKAAKEGAGGVILMSHMGNWEMAARILKRRDPGVPLMLYMGVKDRERMEKMQKEGLSDGGVAVVGLRRETPSSFELIEGIEFLRKGGMVSITGDRIWREDQRAVEVPFLGRRSRLPKTPYVFALLSETPIFVFFAFRTSDGSYRFSCSEPIRVRAKSRGEREEAVRKAARRYASMLEAAVKEYPFQWYHFERFLGDRIENGESRDGGERG